jgi:hypothetical protein
MTTTKTIKVRLTNDFHGTTVRLVGELVGMGEDCSDGMGGNLAGAAMIRVTDAQRKRALRALCGIKECRCGHHGPSFNLDGDPYYKPTCTVVGEVV